MVCTLYLIRHGETLWNHARRYQGHADIALNEAGVRQARALSARLAGEQFAAFYASDLIRAYETARIIARPHGLPVRSLSALREIRFGEWEGLTRDEIRARFPAVSSRWWSRPAETRLPGGETLAETAARVMNAVETITRRHPREKVAVAAHGGTIRVITAAYLGMDLNEYWRLRQDNTALSIIAVFEDGRGQLQLFNDTTHITPDTTHL